MTIAKADRQFFALLSALPPHELGTLETTLARAESDDVVMMTTEGSPNDRLWTAFVESGWMRRGTLPAPGSAAFVLGATGKPAIRALFERYVSWRVRHAAAMDRIEQHDCVELLESLRAKVAEAEGTNQDFAMVVGRLVALAVKSSAEPGRTAQGVDLIAAIARHQLGIAAPDKEPSRH